MNQGGGIDVVGRVGCVCVVVDLQVMVVSGIVGIGRIGGVIGLLLATVLVGSCCFL